MSVSQVRNAVLVLAAALCAACGSATPLVVTHEIPMRLPLADIVTVGPAMALDDANSGMDALRKVVQVKGVGFLAQDRSTPFVYQFGEDGRFVQKYSPPRETLGMTGRLVDFESAAESILFLAERMIVAVARSDGMPRASAELSGTGLKLAQAGEWACVWISTPAVECFDAHLRRVSIVPYEDRHFEKFRHVAWAPLTVLSDGRALLADAYRPVIRVFDMKRQESSELRLGGSEWSDEPFDRLWPPGRPTETEEAAITQAMRRLEKMYRLPDGRLFAFERRWKPTVREVLLFSPTDLSAARVSASIAPVALTASAGVTIFDLIIGTSSTGLVGVIRNSDIAAGILPYVPNAEATCRRGVPCIFQLSFKPL